MEKQQIEDARQILRLKAAEVEQELVQWTRQQAELQKVQVAIDQLLRHLNADFHQEETN